MIKITFPDGSVKEFEKGVTGYEIASGISPRLASEVLCVGVDGKTQDLDMPIDDDASVVFYKWDDDEGKHAFWHSSSHLMAAALEQLYPGIRFGIGPAIENGFYYDVDSPVPITEADLPAIEAKMMDIARSKVPFERSAVAKGEALKAFSDKGDVYKVELIEALEDGTISFYKSGDFVDLCRGPHIRCVLARRREEQDAHPHIRYHFPQEIDARRLSGHARGGQETRPSQARQGVGAFLFLAARRSGFAVMATQRGRFEGAFGEFPQERSETIRLSAGHHPAHRYERPVRYLGSLR